jgi:hypothetical protein
MRSALLLVLVGCTLRADIFVLDGLNPATSFEQLPNTPSGQLLDNVLFFPGATFFCDDGDCLFTVAPTDPSFTVQNSAFNFLPILDSLTPPSTNAFLDVDSHTPHVCFSPPCYVVVFTVADFGPTYSTDSGATLETGQLQTAPFDITWGNGTTTYADTFEFEVGNSGVPSTGIPEPMRLSVWLGLGVVAVKSWFRGSALSV